MNEQQNRLKISFPSQKQLKQKIAKNDISETITELLAITQHLEDKELQDDIILISSQFELYQHEQRLGSTDFDRLFILRTRIGRSLLEIINLLPKNIIVAVDSNQKITTLPRGVSENSLKKQIFVLTILIKISLVFFIISQWEAGGFTKSQTIATIALLLPTFTAYLTAMVREFVTKRNLLNDKLRLKKRINHSFQYLTYSIFPIYALSLFWVIGMKPQGILNFEEMNSWIAIVESGFGVYVGEVIFGLFDKND